MSNLENTEEPIEANIIIYQTPGTSVPVQVRYERETFWITQREMAGLFDCTTDNISLHLSNIYAEGELDEEATTEEFSVVRKEGNRMVRRTLRFYDLDAAIAVGYRVNSLKATRFRQWATRTLREFITKGFVLNDDMLKNGAPFGKDYFDELLVRIRDIRASERRVYQKVTDLFQECSFDYDKDSDEAKRFYATVQNKLHYAVTGKTAAEIVSSRADASLPHMGLTSWKGSPDGRIHSSDVTIAKNYLSEDEIDELNRLVTMFLDDAELRAKDHVLTSMADCSAALDSFLKYNRRSVLPDKGKRSKKQAEGKAKAEFEKFRAIQDATYENDFEKAAKRIEKEPRP